MRVLFCDACGAPMDSPWEQLVVICRYCGAHNLPGRPGAFVPPSVPVDGRPRLNLGGRTYGLDGRGAWFVMPGGQRQADGSFTGELYRTRGSPFNAAPFMPLAPADVTRAGTMALRFSNGETGTLDYVIDGIPVRKAITRQVFAAPLAACSG